MPDRTREVHGVATAGRIDVLVKDDPPFVRLSISSVWQQLTLEEARMLSRALAKSINRVARAVSAKVGDA